MKSIKKSMLKVLVMVALLSSSAFADGDMGGGGLTASGDEGRTGKTVIIRTEDDGDMGGGGRRFFESVISSIYDYFDRLI